MFRVAIFYGSTAQLLASPSPPWVPAGGGRSRSPPTRVTDRVTQLEERLKGLEQNVNELLSERAWWTWWYNHWGKWLQNTVVRLNNAIETFTDAWSASMARRADPDPATDQLMQAIDISIIIMITRARRQCILLVLPMEFELPTSLSVSVALVRAS